MPLFRDPAHPLAEGIEPARLRALRALSAGAMIALALLAPALLPLDGLPQGPLLAIPATLLFLILVGRIRQRGYPARPGPPAVWHLGLDLLAWGLFIALTGGATNPLVSLLLPLVAIAAAALPEFQAWILGGLAVVVYALLWRFFLPLPLTDEALAVRLHLLGMGATFALSVAVSVWFISRLTRAVRLRDQALAEARERALRDDWVVSLGTLAAGAAHQLSTPLATLSMLIGERLADPATDPEWRDDLELAAAQVRTCKQALTQLTARAGQPRAGDGTGRGVARAEAQAVEAWLCELAEAWVVRHPAADLRLVPEASLTGCRIVPDLALERAIHNLVDNAVRASPESVRVEAGCAEGYLWMCVRDRGPGLLPPDSRAPPSETAGLGIGLQLTRGTLERLGGELILTPNEGGGTRARLRLPLAGFAPSATGDETA